MINSARRAGSPSNSQPIFNVDDFGARGDGRDDSEVKITQHQLLLLKFNLL